MHRRALRPVIASLMFVLSLRFDVASALSEPLPRSSAEQAGFSTVRLQGVRKYFESKISSGEIQGAVYLLSRKGKVVLFDAVGFADVETSTPMTTENIFRLASMTKPITAIALMTLYEEGRFKMNDPISKYLPEFEGIKVAVRDRDGSTVLLEPERPPTMRDVLRHTAGFTYGRNGEYGDAALLGDPYTSTLSEFISRLASFPLQ